MLNFLDVKLLASSAFVFLYLIYGRAALALLDAQFSLLVLKNSPTNALMWMDHLKVILFFLNEALR
jgi:hypothetical protein